MSNDKKLTAADLAMYLGCECQIEAPGDEKFTAIMTGADVSSGRATVLVNGANYGPSTYIVANIKPILRRLSDMTEDGAREFYQIVAGEQWEGRPEWWPIDMEPRSCLWDWLSLYDEQYCSNQTIAIGNPTAWRYLLSRRFDLFGWIDAGLALDAATLTKTEKP